MNDELLSMIPEEEDAQKTAEDMAKSISKMYEDRDKKALDAKTSLVTQLRITSEKYLTANGVMTVLQTLRDAEGDLFIGIDKELMMAHEVACEMSDVATRMADHAEETAPDIMGSLCNAYYDPSFAVKKEQIKLKEFVTELMRLQLCQNVGPNADDIEGFCASADIEIEKARENLRDYCNAHDLDFNELCGPHEDCYDCLCEICVNDCKSHKLIRDGEGAYDVCDKFYPKDKRRGISL